MIELIDEFYLRLYSGRTGLRRVDAQFTRIDLLPTACYTQY